MNRTYNLNNMLNQLPEALSSFPDSTNESPMLYNYNKLANILQKKEISKIVNEEKCISTAHTLSSQFSLITQDIAKGSWISNGPMNSYMKLQKKIDNSLNGIMYLYAKQWGISVKALYYYKNGNYDKAIDYSTECIILNEYLIREGIYTLLFRAAEQNKNIIRIFFRRNDWQRGASYAHDFLNYLLNGESKVLLGKIFYESKFWNEIPYVREGYAYECFRAMVSLILHIEINHLSSITNISSLVFDELNFEVTTPDRQIIADWIKIKNKFSSQNYELFILGVTEFMNEPKCKIYDILKISLLFDLIKIIRHRQDFKNGNYIVDVLNKYMTSNLNAEVYLKRDLSATNFIRLTDDR